MHPTVEGEWSDEALMSRAQVGDADAFAQLYDRHAGRALRVASAICRDRGRAEDAVQEGFLAIWRRRNTYSPACGNFRSWSMKIVKNRAIDSVRAAAIRPQTQFGNDQVETPGRDPRATSPQQEVVARSERDQILASLRRLPDAQAEVIVLAFYGELSHSEIAAQLNLPPGTVKGRMRLGLKKLRLALDESATD